MRNSNAAAARLATVVIVFGLSQLAHAQPANPAWIQLHPTGGPPGARLVPAAAYDPATNSMIVFGGEAQLSATSNNYNDVWVLANADGLGGTPAWTQLAPFGLAPIPRFGAGAAYDPGSNRLIVFGGAYVDYPAISGACTSFVNGGTANDVWVLTNANGSGGAPSWTPLVPMGVPPAPRRTSVVVYDAANNRLIVFGGSEACGKLNDVWVLSNANGLGGTPAWTQLNPSGALPATRGEIGSAGAYDAANNQLIIFGGRSDLAVLNDVWVLSNANGLGGPPAWTQLSPSGALPPGREAHAVTYDAAANTLTVIGGADFSETQLFSDVWQLSTANGLGGTPGWTQLTPSGAGPLPRAGHTAVYHQTTRRSVIFGGVRCVPCAGLNDTWVLADVVPFAAFSAAAQIHPASSAFTVQGAFTPGSGGSIDPLTQDVTLQLGGFSATIPAGSFAAMGGSFTFTGVINGVPMDATMQQQTGGYAFTFDGAGAPNLPAANPVTVGLGIGNNGGTVQVTATSN